MAKCNLAVKAGIVPS